MNLPPTSPQRPLTGGEVIEEGDVSRLPGCLSSRRAPASPLPCSWAILPIKAFSPGQAGRRAGAGRGCGQQEGGRQQPIRVEARGAQRTLAEPRGAGRGREGKPGATLRLRAARRNGSSTSTVCIAPCSPECLRL